MKNWLFIALLFPFSVPAERFESGDFQVNLVELYTSEGCSSCPPAEAWLSRIYRQGFKNQYVVPLALHVTYWDYLGWKDKFSSKTYDQRQRRMVAQEGGRTVYTPQFFLNGKTVRNVSSMKSKVDQVSARPAAVRIKSKIDNLDRDIIVDVSLVRLQKNVEDILRVIVIPYENDIKSAIEAGENEGVNTVHQYVAKEMQSALMSLKGSNKRQFYFKKAGLKNWSGIVILVEEGDKVIQVLNASLKKPG